MNKKIMSGFIYSVLLIPLMGFAEGGSVQQQSGISMQQGAAISGVGQSVAGMAGESEVAQYIGAGTNLVVGAMMTKQNCPGEDSGQKLNCAYGAMMIAQGAQMVQGGQQTGGVGDDIAEGGAGLIPSSPNLPDTNLAGGTNGLSNLCSTLGSGCGPLGEYIPSGVDGNNLSGKDLETIASNLQNDLKRQGVNVSANGDSVSMAGVGDIPSNVLGDSAALAEAGFDSEAVSSMFSNASAMSDALAAKLRGNSGGPSVSSMGFSSGGGGGSRRGGRKYKFEEDDDLSKMLGKFQKKKDRKPASAAGMVRRLPNGEVIGAKGDNIFNMIHRHYRNKAKQNYFLGPDARPRSQ